MFRNVVFLASFLEEIGSNTCSLLNCKDYWKRPNNDVSGALSLRTSLTKENFKNYNFLVGRISYKLFYQNRTNIFFNRSRGSFSHPWRRSQFFLFHVVIGP